MLVFDKRCRLDRWEAVRGRIDVEVRRNAAVEVKLCVRPLHASLFGSQNTTRRGERLPLALYVTMKGAWLIPIFVVIVAFVTVEGASGPIMPCTLLAQQHSVWLNSSSQSTRFSGTGFTVYPNMPSGRPFLGAWQALEITDIIEAPLVPSLTLPSTTQCIGNYRTPIDAEAVTLRRLKLEDTMCIAYRRASGCWRQVLKRPTYP